MQAQTTPVYAASKARRIAWSAPPNLVSAAYMKLLREGNQSMKVYDINPYVEVYQFRDNVYGLFNPSCDGSGDVWMWLIAGPKRAMLIDTAFGLGDMKGLVDKITGRKPLIVANTHAGPEHVLGNCRFDEVYCHEYDLEGIKDVCKPGAWDYLFDRDGKNIWLEFDKNDLPVYRDYELVAVKDGHTFNLGGDYEVELVWTAGNTPGHAMYLDKQSRCLFTGDDVSSDVMRCGMGPAAGRPNGQYANLTTYRDCLTKLVARFDAFDYLFPGHYMVNLENHVLAGILETVNQIIAKPESYTYKFAATSVNGGLGQERMEKYVRGFSTIAYSQNGISPPK